MMLSNKIEKSIDLIKRTEKLALLMSPDGYYLAFSGGKDSQVIYRLAEIAGVKFTAWFSPSSIDPPENIRFIRQNYPKVQFEPLKTNIYKLALKKGFLPTRVMRYCCTEFKEKKGANHVVMLGVRRQESIRRANRQELAFGNKNTKKFLEGQVKQFEHQCIKGYDKITFNPILEWTTKEVWRFIYDQKLPVNPCYKTSGRVGCIACLFSTQRQIKKDFKQYPYVKTKWLSVCAELNNSPKSKFTTPEDRLNWWISGLSPNDYFECKRQLTIKF